MIFIGFNDLVLFLLGYVLVRGDELEYVDVINKIVVVVCKYGKWVFCLLNFGVLCKEYFEVFDIVVLSYDVWVI